MRQGTLAGLFKRSGVCRLSFVVLSCLAVTACSDGLPKEFPAPDLTVKDVFTGHTISLTEYRGRPVVLYFFASW